MCIINWKKPIWKAHIHCDCTDAEIFKKWNQAASVRYAGDRDDMWGTEKSQGEGMTLCDAGMAGSCQPSFPKGRDYASRVNTMKNRDFAW